MNNMFRLFFSCYDLIFLFNFIIFVNKIWLCIYPYNLKPKSSDICFVLYPGCHTLFSTAYGFLFRVGQVEIISSLVINLHVNIWYIWCKLDLLQIFIFFSSMLNECLLWSASLSERFSFESSFSPNTVRILLAPAADFILNFNLCWF